MWREWVSELLPEGQLAPPATAQQLAAAEARLGSALPVDLRQLLSETNGLRDELLTDVVWPIEQIAESNNEFRARADFTELYGPFDGLLFFGDNGGGDQFAFPTDAETDTATADVFVWEHETDARRRVAESLRDYLVRCLTADGDDWYVDFRD